MLFSKCAVPPHVTRNESHYLTHNALPEIFHTVIRPGAILDTEVNKMKKAVTGKVLVPGRVLIGPKEVGSGYARIVALKDGSGSIECFNTVTGKWSEAPTDMTFNDVWHGETVVSPEVLARIDKR